RTRREAMRSVSVELGMRAARTLHRFGPRGGSALIQDPALGLASALQTFNTVAAMPPPPPTPVAGPPHTTCPRCGTPLAMEARLWGNCGGVLPQAGPIPAGGAAGAGMQPPPARPLPAPTQPRGVHAPMQTLVGVPIGPRGPAAAPGPIAAPAAPVPPPQLASA